MAIAERISPRRITVLRHGCEWFVPSMARPHSPRAEESHRPAKNSCISLPSVGAQLNWKENRTGKEGSSKMHIPDTCRRDRPQTPPPQSEIKNKQHFSGCDPVKTNRTIKESAAYSRCFHSFTAQKTPQMTVGHGSSAGKNASNAGRIGKFSNENEHKSHDIAAQSQFPGTK